MSTNDDLKKAQQNKLNTSSQKKAWEEFLRRDQSVASSKSVQAAEVISTLAGTWTSVTGLDPQLKISDSNVNRLANDGLEVPKVRGDFKIGKPGLPEINFPLYDFRTNRSGSGRNPALLGHPISFSVVGPTLKSPFINWQWTVTDNSATPGLGDVLSLDVKLDGSAVTANVGEIYGFDPALPNGGLYLYITQTGADGDGDAFTGGGRSAISGNANYGERAKFEIFRIDSFSGNDIVLNPNKRLADYFDIPVAPATVRAFNVIQPYVTRLAAIPSGNGAGTEQNFVFAAPEIPADPGLNPPFENTLGSAADGGFEPTGALLNSYVNRIFRIPNSNPTQTLSGESLISGRLESATGDGAPTTDAGAFVLRGLSTTIDASEVNKVIHITSVTVNDSTVPVDTVTNTKLSRVLGWYTIGEILAPGTNIILYRMRECDPETGEIFFGPGPFEESIFPATVDVEFTIHESVSDFFSQKFSYDRLEGIRLQNLIDPTWVGRSNKVLTDIKGVSPARADRAIFDTVPNANPGSLLDLGFRVVLFPAKDDGFGNPVPDFDKPITSNNIVIDSGVSEAQYFDVDYSGGLVTLSHPPTGVDTDNAITPNGIISGTKNPEGRIILYAACVPYSQEESQLGSGVRITAGEIFTANSGVPSRIQTDAYSRKVSAAIVQNQTLGVYPDNFLDLSEDLSSVLPRGGHVEIVSSETDLFAPSIATIGYNDVETFTLTGEPAKALIIVDDLSTAGDTITIGGVVLTAVLGAPGANQYTALAFGDATAQALEIANALSNPTNGFLDVVISSAVVSNTVPNTIILTSTIIGSAANSIGLSDTGADISTVAFSGGADYTFGTRLTGVYSSTAFPLVLTSGRAVLRREVETDYILDSTYGSAARSTAVRFSYADLEVNDDGSLTVTPTGVGGPAEELRSNFPLGQQADGSLSEIARFYLGDDQNWTVESPSFLASDAHEIGLEIKRGKIYTSSVTNISDVTLQAFTNRGVSITPNNITNLSYATPPNKFKLVVDSGLASLRVGTGFQKRAPVEEINSGKLCAIVEGSTIATYGESVFDPLTAGGRFIVNVKKFTERDTRDDSAKELFDLDEGPLNPIHWFAFSASGGDDAASVAAAINAHYSTAQGINPAEVDNSERVNITGRQVSVMPSKYYLQSADITGGVTFTDPALYAFTIFSADPAPENRRKWVTIHVRATNGANFNTSDSDACAEFLNSFLYDPGNSFYVGDQLDRAGFYGVDPLVDPSPNPELFSNSWAERPLLWIGGGDPRHPDGSNTVCLIAGGWGSSDPAGAVRDFFNVMVEFHKTREDTTTNDAGTVLGGDFDFAIGESARFGLFFGDYADEKNQGGFTLPDPSDFPGDAVEANASVEIGGFVNGVEPLGAYVGSHPINSVTTSGDNYVLDLELPTGRTDYFIGPQRSPVNYGDSVSNFNSMQEPYSSSVIGADALDIRATPYLGRWVYPVFERVAVPLRQPDTSGLAHIWVRYGMHPHDERGFTSPLTDASSGYSSYLLAVGVGSDFEAPVIAPGSIRVGDKFLAHVPPVGSRDGTEDSWRGVILNANAPAHDFGAGTKPVNFTVMYTGSGYDAGTNHVNYKTQSQPNQISSFSVLSLGSNTQFSASVIPDANAVTFSSAVQFLLEHGNGPLTFADNDGKDGSGLDGGSATSDVQSSAAIISGGRMHLVSTLGPESLAGVSFSNPVMGSENPDSPLRLASTFIDHGVFTTSVSLQKAGFGSAQDSAGLYDAFKANADTDSGKIGGHQVGGVGGIRISGDAQIWLTNLKYFGSTQTTAVVRATHETTSANTLRHGPVTSTGGDSGAAHIPSGFGAARADNTSLHFLQQEATVSIGITRHDLQALRIATGNLQYPESDDVFNTPELVARNSAILSDIPIPVPFLTGCYLQLGSSAFIPADASNDANEGVWRVIGTPMVTLASSENFVYDNPQPISRFFTKNPQYYFKGISNTFSYPIAANKQGHPSMSAIVAYIQVRVERFAAIHVSGVARDYDQTFFAQTTNNPGRGHTWGFFADEEASRPIYVADVVDPGGSPTGVPTSINGLTLNPSAVGLGYNYFPMDLVSVFADTDNTDNWPLVGRGKLFGIHENRDHRGRRVSQAYFAMEASGTATSNLAPNSYARMVVYSAHREDRLDELSQPITQGEFQKDAGGRVTFVGHAQRLGNGVLIDPGLGLVQATAFRASPRPATTDTLGSLVLWGQNATYPLPNYSSEKSNVGVGLTSTFNKAEFYESLSVVGPEGHVIFEDGRAAHGVFYNLNSNLVATLSELTPLQLGILRQNTTAFGSVINSGTSITPNDSLFPLTSLGVKFKSPGGIIYERAFRTLDATGSNALLSSYRGKSSEAGISGLEVPAYGQYMLLPKGPPTIYGTGTSDFQSTPTGRTPLDRPLYEFINGSSQDGMITPHFSVNPSQCFDNLPVGASVLASPHPSSPHLSSPGSLSQAYRHSTSREDGTKFGYEGEIFDALFNVTEQMRLLDGMVLEDVDNGTFYTVGSVGRWKSYENGGLNTGVTNSVSQPGVGSRSSVNGSLPVSAGRHAQGTITIAVNPGDGDTVTVDGVVLTFRAAPAVGTDVQIGGSTTATAGNLSVVINAQVPRVISRSNGTSIVKVVVRKVGAKESPVLWSTSNAVAINLSPGGGPTGGINPEIIFDLNTHTNPLVDIRTDPDNGYGDRVDDDSVRKPLTGHRFRVTPNVEFVPVLGPSGVRGGLLPPIVGGNPLPNADAIFYAATYSFTAADKGRFIYICGTHNYSYTGWWVVIDVRANYSIGFGAGTTTVNAAVLRKWKRGFEDFAGDTSTFDGAFPLRNRAPLVKMVADRKFNDSKLEPMLFGGTPSDLILELASNTGANAYSVLVPSATLTGAGVVDCNTLATYANSVTTLNGGDVALPGGSVSGWIVWNSVSTNYYDRGLTVEVTYDLSLLTEAQQAFVLGDRAALRIQFSSNTTAGGVAPYLYNHNVMDSEQTIGFYSYVGHSSQIDRGAGDRNNFSLIGMPATNDPNNGGAYQSYSAARGLRWVFSSPLLEEHVGSYLHLTKPSKYYFGTLLSSQDDGITPVDTQAWASGNPRNGDDVLYVNDIYRINRCPNTGDIVLGGDCEQYFPEIVGIPGNTGDPLMKGVPVVYSSLSLASVWPDTVTNTLPATGGLDYLGYYALQPIAREKIVNVSPRSGVSNSLMGHSGDNPTGNGPDGIGMAMVGRDHDPAAAGVGDVRESAAHNISNWWVLMNRHNTMRTRIGELRTIANTWYANQFGTDFGSQTEMFNSNNSDPVTTTGLQAPSVYTWTPAGEYWYLNVPKAVRDSWQYDASCPPPTLMVDLTETFTQAMQPGGGTNSPYPEKFPKGVRLTRLWVNFGVWGKDLASRDKDNMPGYNPGGNINDVLEEYHVAFNLILEIPGSQARVLNSSGHPLGSGTTAMPFGDRAPTAAYNHPDNSPNDGHYPGGTIVVPLYMNREAGDMMPNVMERWVSAGPVPSYNDSVFLVDNPDPDWVAGDYEHGFGTGGDSNAFDLHAQETLSSNAHNPVVWGGIDTALAANGGPFTSPGASRVLGTPFPRSSRVSGGVRSAFTSGLSPDGLAYSRVNPDSLSPSAQTGIVITHAGKYPRPEPGLAGSFRAVGGNPMAHGGRHTGHGFTVALTPVGDSFNTPKNGGGSRIAVDPSVNPVFGDDKLAVYGRRLNMDITGEGKTQEPYDRPFKVGNWLDHILDRYGIAVPSGSMLPPGARVYLEITAAPGPIGRPANHPSATSTDESASGCWVGGIKAIFDVETADGTAHTVNVNNLGGDGS